MHCKFTVIMNFKTSIHHFKLGLPTTLLIVSVIKQGFTYVEAKTSDVLVRVKRDQEPRIVVFHEP